ncbi:hypothetical protein RJ641_007773 [Dillenia turbinata]|uniref:RRM domain-containing protein n=1 Tax=Dillenia turbinata TaxID=194707 RepID=A0AAN8Z4C7_9MAGN
MAENVESAFYKDVRGGHDLPSYYHDDDRSGSHRVTRDTDSIAASYDRYLRSAPISSYGGGESARSISGGVSGHRVDDPRIMGIGSIDPEVAAKSRTLGLGGGRAEIPLPPDASSTLFAGGDPLVLCFVDFASPAHAATAMDALQGYKFDELDRDSNSLRLQFARYPGARSGGGPRGKR